MASITVNNFSLDPIAKVTQPARVNSDYRVVVIGGGALGLSTALHLVHLGFAGKDITVLERKSIAGASSGLSVGIIETQYLDRQAIELRAYSMRFFTQLEETTGLAITRNGYLRLAHTQEDMVRFAQSVRFQQDFGIQDARLVNKQELPALVPDLFIEDLEGGLFGPSDGYIDGHAYCMTLADLLARRQVDVKTQTEVITADRRFNTHRLTTSRGVIQAETVVNAAGAWGSRVAEMLGTPTTVLPQRHRAAVARLPRDLGYVMPSVMDYVPNTARLGLYFRHETPRSMIVGLHTEDLLHDIVDPDDRDRSDGEYTASVAERLLHRLPKLSDMRLSNVWSGFYPMSLDGLPIIGPSGDDSTVVLAVGAGGSGLQASPAIGLIAAEWIALGRPTTISGSEQLRPDRSSLAADPGRITTL